MPGKRAKKGRKDQKQDKRIKSLEKMVYKTIENKQVDAYFNGTFGRNVASIGMPIFLGQGAEDGGLSLTAASPATARVGNSITLMSQDIRVTVSRNPQSTRSCKMRMLVVESVNGSQALTMGDVLQYADVSTYGDNVFNSPYKVNGDINKKYKIHADKILQFREAYVNASGNIVGGISGPEHKFFRFNIKNFAGGKNKVVTYEDNTPAANNHNLRILITGTADPASTTERHRISMVVRSRYKDA